MTLRAAPLRALWWCWLTLVLGGCANLPFFNDKTEEATGEPLVAQYELEVDASEPLQKLLLDYLDISRFRNAPRSDAVTSAELDRLAGAAPAQARAALGEGYFSANVTIPRSDGSAGLPRLTMHVVPGPRVVVSRVAINAAEPLAPRMPSPEEPWSDRLEHLVSTWALRPGEPFRQPAWSAAKVATLAALRADGYASATWQTTLARVDATDNTAGLDLVVAGGPLFRLGEIRVQGISRFDESAVRRLATFFPGTQYSERLLLGCQVRVRKGGLLGGVSGGLDTPGPP
jgi:translocation and assembly module TamA